jgi:hypothetical protein
MRMQPDSLPQATRPFSSSYRGTRINNLAHRKFAAELQKTTQGLKEHKDSKSKS